MRRPVQEPNQRLAGTESLGRGEAEAIKLAQEINADLLLTDGRTTAKPELQRRTWVSDAAGYLD